MLFRTDAPRALVDGDLETARELHAPDFQLITPTGRSLSGEQYLGEIASGLSTSYGSRQRFTFISTIRSPSFVINLILKSLPTGVPFLGLVTGIPTHTGIRALNGRSFGPKRRGSLLHKDSYFVRLILGHKHLHDLFSCVV